MTENIYLLVYYAFLITSIVLFTISFFSSGSLLYNTSIAGYVVTIITLLLMMVFVVSGILKYSPSTLQIFFSLGPFFFLFFLIAGYLYYLITFKTRILDGTVSPSFYTFQHISLLIMMLQLFLFSYGTDFKTGKLSKTNLSFIYLLCVISLFILYTIRHILLYFITDGFHSSL